MKANSKEVNKKVDKHISLFWNLDDYADINSVLEDFTTPNFVANGGLLIYYDDQRNFLNTLNLNNNSNREFTDEDVFKMYVMLCNRAIIRFQKECLKLKERNKK